MKRGVRVRYGKVSPTPFFLVFEFYHGAMWPLLMGGAASIQTQVINTSLSMCQSTFILPLFYFPEYLPVRRVSGASAHYKPISRYQLIFTFDSASALMGAGTRVSVHRSLNNVMKPGADLIYNPTPWLNSIMSFFSLPFLFSGKTEITK